MPDPPPARWARFDERSPLARNRRRVDVRALLILSLVATWQWLLAAEVTLAQLALRWGLLLAAWGWGIATHELGHAIAARLAGLDPYALLLGSGRSVLRFQVASVSVDIAWMPSTGSTLFGSKRRDATRWRTALTLMGGPSVTLLWIATSIVGLGALPDSTLAPPHPAALQLFVGTLGGSLPVWGPGLAALLVSNILILMTTLLPRGSPSQPGGGGADLPRVWHLLRSSSQADEGGPAWRERREFAQLLALREYDRAARYARHTLAENPNAWELRLDWASMLFVAGHYDDASAQLEHLVTCSLPRGPEYEALWALTATTLARALYESHPEEPSQHARQWAEQALSLLPHDHEVVETHRLVVQNARD